MTRTRQWIPTPGADSRRATAVKYLLSGYASTEYCFVSGSRLCTHTFSCINLIDLESIKLAYVFGNHQYQPNEGGFSFRPIIFLSPVLAILPSRGASILLQRPEER